MIMRSSVEKRHDAFINRINYASGLNDFPVDPSKLVASDDLVTAFDEWRKLENLKKLQDISHLAVLPPS